jgi:hypothetical protein
MGMAGKGSPGTRINGGYRAAMQESDMEGAARHQPPSRAERDKPGPGLTGTATITP